MHFEKALETVQLASPPSFPERPPPQQPQQTPAPLFSIPFQPLWSFPGHKFLITANLPLKSYSQDLAAAVRMLTWSPQDPLPAFLA